MAKMPAVIDSEFLLHIYLFSQISLSQRQLPELNSRSLYHLSSVKPLCYWDTTNINVTEIQGSLTEGEGSVQLTSSLRWVVL
jgi:hypothetical protein